MITMRKAMISGFADEAARDFRTQLKTVRSLGMQYLCIRALDGRSIVDFTEDEARSYIKPMLDEYGLKVSSLGSPIGKVPVDDEAAFNKQCVQLETLCRIAKILDCKYIRMFSFYIPKDKNPADYADVVIAKMRKFIAICEKASVIPMHENEKGIFGDIGTRCEYLYRTLSNTTLVAVFDFANFVQCDDDIVAAYKLLRPYIGYVHIKDALYSDHQVVLAGTGDGHLREIFADLERTGYDGFLTMEPHLRTFESLKSLEATVSEQTVRDAYPDGIAAYTAQYKALTAILDEIGVQ